MGTEVFYFFIGGMIFWLSSLVVRRFFEKPKLKPRVIREVDPMPRDATDSRPPRKQPRVIRDLDGKTAEVERKAEKK